MSEYKRLKAQYDELKQKEEAKVIAKWCANLGILPSELATLAQAKAEDRLVVLPCKLGDMIWRINPYKEIEPYKVIEFSFHGDSKYIRGAYEKKWLGCFNFDEFGKTVFLTKAEAEAALQQIGGQK